MCCAKPECAPAGKGMPSVLINPLYGNTPSTGSVDVGRPTDYTPATVPRSSKRR